MLDFTNMSEKCGMHFLLQTYQGPSPKPIGQDKALIKEEAKRPTITLENLCKISTADDSSLF